ncbi:SDR family oxidoreductase [uncultured Pseudodesulfovibrio sp.]|uniref:tetratricopeptide repeat protein n=1 Tax=uncultured Pseudodesulfovibrio sp. TaxID=2035858 RepID=UPI0029C7D439|nr:SDR family oxidoreductase [uncultured Pseudodesulfovibrio sp.]
MSDQESKVKPEQAIIRDGAENIKGIFSTQTVAKVGTGTTQRKTIQKTYWNVEEVDENTISVQPLNRNYVPSGPSRQLERDEFLTKFNPEPEFYVSTVYPAIKEMDGAIVRGEKHRERGAAYSAEFEYQQAMAIDEENVRANFGLGLTYLDRGDQVKANDIFERLVGLEAAFEVEHKHLFNDFGINMRKNKMYDQALQYYLRAAELVKNDEHLLHNIARCYFEKGNVEECKAYLLKSLEVNPDLEASKQFWAYLQAQGHVKNGEGPEVSIESKSRKPSQDEANAEKSKKAGSVPLSINLD